MMRPSIRGIGIDGKPRFFGERYFIGNVVYVDDLGREPINVPGGRLAKVRYAPIADVSLHSSETTQCAISRL
jgi:hypothetical protein